MAIICGFNEFGQLNHFDDSTNRTFETNVKNFEDSSKKFVNLKQHRILGFYWSYCVFNSGEDVYISGFVGTESNCKKKLITPNKERITQVVCSRRHFLVLTDSGQCWKYTLLNDQWINLNPVLFADSAVNACVTHIGCGETQNIAVSLSGWVYNIPSRISFLPEITVNDVKCGKEHCVLLTTEGQVFTWGTGIRGQLGHGDLEPEEQPREVQVLSKLNVKNMAVGGWHTWVITDDGKLFSWGWNSNGQLACPLSECKVQTEPKLLEWPTEAHMKVIKIGCGSKHTVILMSLKNRTF